MRCVCSVYKCKYKCKYKCRYMHPVEPDRMAMTAPIAETCAARQNTNYIVACC